MEVIKGKSITIPLPPDTLDWDGIIREEGIYECAGTHQANQYVVVLITGGKLSTFFIHSSGTGIQSCTGVMYNSFRRTNKKLVLGVV